MAKLGEVCKLNMGQSPDSSSYNCIGDGIPFFQGNADFGEIHPNIRVWCNAPTKIAHPGEILISVRAPIGAMNIADCECCIGRGLASISADEAVCTTKYLWYGISSKIEELNAKGTGSTFKAINKKTLEEAEIPIRDLMEQERIAANLDRVTALISLRKQQITKLDELVKARFVEKSKEWQAVPGQLNEFLEDITYGFTNPMPDAEEGPWKVTAKDVVNGHINILTARKTTNEAFERLTNKSKPRKGDVLLTKDGTLGRVAVVDVENLCVNQSVAVMRCNNKIYPEFLAMILQMPEYQRKLLEDSGGGTIKHLYITKVDKMLISVPDLVIQKDLLMFAKRVEQQKQTVQQSLEKLALMKKALMQEYFG